MTDLPALHGIILLDKPTGLTSNSALQRVKRLLKQKKAGHTGCLDPLATGMLPLVFGEATKFSQWLLEAEKTYTCRAQLGVTTTTGDSEGEVLSTRSVGVITDEALEEVLSSLRGTIQQYAPKYSALKYEGRPLYEYARKGIDVPRKCREVTILELRVIARTEDSVDLFVRCSKGTYIRSIVEDLGEALGCGAHVSMLRRLHVSPFEDESAMHSLEDLQQAVNQNLPLTPFFYPLDVALSHLPRIDLSAEESQKLYFGQTVFCPSITISGPVSLYNSHGQCIGVGEIEPQGRLVSRRLVSESTYNTTGYEEALLA